MKIWQHTQVSQSTCIMGKRMKLSQLNTLGDTLKYGRAPTFAFTLMPITAGRSINQGSP